MQNSTVDVLIVGAGPTGLTMVCELLRRGVMCRILEKAAAPATTSRAIGLQARSMEVFANMGIIEPMLAQGITGIGVNAYSGDSPLFTLDFRFLADESIPYPYGVLLPQNQTEQTLLGLLHQRGGLVEHSREVLDLQQEDEQVIVTVRHREDGHTEQIAARWLIGCDGAHSSVRKAAGLAFEGTTYPEEFLLADVDLDWQRSHSSVHVWLHQQGQFAALPLPDNHWRLMADLPAVPGASVPAASLELFQSLLRERTGDTTTTISNPTWLSNFQIHRKLVSSYWKGRVLLAGDAAHVHSPFGGQGANTGIQDAFNLAWKLALVIHDKASETLLSTYEEERRPIAKSVLTGTSVLTRVFYDKNPFIRLLRDHVVVPLFKQKSVQRRLLWQASELGIHYRHASLSQTHRETLIKRRIGEKGRSTLLHGGDRAPDGRCLRLPEREETTLFQQFQHPVVHLLLFDGFVHTHFSTLKRVEKRHGSRRLPGGKVYTPNPNESSGNVLELAQRVQTLLKNEVQVHLVISKERQLDWEGSLLYDATHTVHAHYGATVPSLFVIRPDGYIGLLCQPVREQPLIDYLQRLFQLPAHSETISSLAGKHNPTEKRIAHA